uniref:Uncharacterized protein n=1 Tax=Cacopsylla melanoneura TaxID=428564 RepID=A0A8D8QMZ1_9HEMI
MESSRGKPKPSKKSTRTVKPMPKFSRTLRQRMWMTHQPLRQTSTPWLIFLVRESIRSIVSAIQRTILTTTFSMFSTSLSQFIRNATLTTLALWSRRPCWTGWTE